MRIIENEDARRYVCDAVLYDFSHLGRMLAPNVRLEFANPVPVYSENRPGKPVGYADVFLDEDRLMAQMFIDYATPERLDMEIGKEVNAVPAGDFSISGRVEQKVDGVWLPHVTLSRGREEGVGGVCRPSFL
jgi:hypothetical protein